LVPSVCRCEVSAQKHEAGDDQVEGAFVDEFLARTADGIALKLPPNMRLVKLFEPEC
jgi:hypothetical protein